MKVLEHDSSLPSSFKNMNYGVVIHRNFKILKADQGYATYLGYESVDDILRIPSLLDLIHPSEHQRVKDNYQKLISGEVDPSVQIFQNLNAKKELVTVMTLEYVTQYKGEVALQVTVIDISEHVENQRRLLETEERYKELVEGALQAILVHDNFKPIFCNQAYADLLGFSSISDVLALESILDLIPDENRASAINEYNELISGEIESAKYDARGYDSDGEIIWVNIFGKCIHWNGKPVVQVSFMDITEQHLLREQIKFRATYDGLTSILNRTSISEQTENLIKLAKAGQTPLSCILIDIDHFKLVNDQYGHCCGDKVLIEFTKLCQTSLRGADLFGRWGGEEFLIILPETSPENSVKLADRIRKKIELLPITIPSTAKPINITVSMGVSILNKTNKNLHSMVSQADKCLYKAKNKGRNQVLYQEND